MCNKQTADECERMNEEEDCKNHTLFLIFCLRQIYHDHTQTHTIITLIEYQLSKRENNNSFPK